MEHFRDLANAWAAFRDNPGAWVAVITGVEKDFCTGADLKKFIPELTIVTAFSRRRTPRRGRVPSPRNARRADSDADAYRPLVRRRSRVASDSTQLTSDNTIAAQIAVHQK